MDGRAQTRNFVSVSEAGRTVVADRPPAGDIKRELWPNLCRRACSMLSLHRIGRRARTPETPANCVPITSQPDMDRNGPARERALADFATEQLLSLTAEARQREKARERTDGSEHWLQMIWKLRPSVRGESGVGFTILSSIPRRILPAVVTPGFSVPITSFRRFQPGAAHSLARSGRELCSPATLRPVMNQK